LQGQETYEISVQEKSVFSHPASETYYGIDSPG